MRDTMHLSVAEHGAYAVLLDAYYATEKPLPAAYEALNRMCRAMTGVERNAVKSVADQFFPSGEDGLRHNRRADHEIGIAQSTIEKQRHSGVESAAKRWSTDGSTHRSAIQPPTTNLQPPTSTNQPPTPNRQRKNGGAASPPSDPAKEEIWNTGKALLIGQGMSKDTAGSFLGKLVKDFGQVLVLQAVRDCAATTPAEVKAWLTARCQERRSTPAGSVEARNRAAADAFIAKGPDATH